MLGDASVRGTPACGDLYSLVAYTLNEATITDRRGHVCPGGIMDRTIGSGPIDMFDNINAAFGGDPRYFEKATKSWRWW